MLGPDPRSLGLFCSGSSPHGQPGCVPAWWYSPCTAALAVKPWITQLANVFNVFKVLGGLAEGDWAVSGHAPPNPWPALPVRLLYQSH